METQDTEDNDISVTKFLGQKSNDIVVTMFQNLDTTVTKFLGDYEITIIEFLNSVAPKYLEENDISVTKFLDRSIAQFLEENDISVTKFLNDHQLDNDVSVTKFLTDTAVSNVQPGQKRPNHHEKPTANNSEDNEYYSHYTGHYDHYDPYHPRYYADDWHYRRPAYGYEEHHYYPREYEGVPYGYRSNGEPVASYSQDNGGRRRKHKPELTPEEKEARELSKREHEEQRKREEERLKREEEIAHQEEERIHRE